MSHDLGSPCMDEAQDWEKPGMGEPAFRGEPEALVGPKIRVSMVWVGPVLGGPWYERARLQG